jgi:hypothetical protein
VRDFRCGLLVALAPAWLSSCALVLSFSGFDGLSEDGGAEDGARAGDAALASLGCYQDKSEPRDLPYSPYSSTDNTIEACVTACTDHKYPYAGAQDGNQCYCGNSYGAFGPSKACSSPCPGNDAEICGGPYANSIYRTPVSLDSGAD